MINRRLIRTKVVQILYSYYQSGKDSLEQVDEELLKSMDKTHEMYHLFLTLILAVRDYAEERLELKKNRLLATKEDASPNRRFVDNRFVTQLGTCSDLVRFQDINGFLWGEHRPLVKELWEAIEQTEVYAEYMEDENNDYEQDKRIWVWIVRHIFSQCESLGQVLEELSIYWNDDAEVVLSFVEKTIKRFKEEDGEGAALLPLYKDESDKQFARTLLHESILKREAYREDIGKATKNWEMDRIAFMDVVVMQVAMAEIYKFPEIPLKVTLNEYIDIVKAYSTDKSALFVNGILDVLGKQIRKIG